MSSTTSSASSTKHLPGHIGGLTVKETDVLKQLWTRLFAVFKQKGSNTPSKPPKEASRKSSWFSKNTHTDYFIGVTEDPQWLTLPLEQAIPLIPGVKLEATFWNMVSTDNPDAVCLRYLRARKWELDAAYDMLVNTLRWRLVNRVDDIIALGETGLCDHLNSLKPKLGDVFVQQLGSGKAYFGGPDKEGRGICFINVAKHYKENQPHEIIKIMTIYIMETSRVIVRQPVETCCVVFDMNKFTLKNMDFDFVKFLVSCFEAYYPETLGSLLIHRAPWVFSTVWNLIHSRLDPVVATKIHFTKDLNEILKFVDASALTGSLTGEKSKVTMNEAVNANHVPPGTLKLPSTAAYKKYKETVKEFEGETIEWAKQKTTEVDSAAARHELALKYRHARIRAENDIRGPTRYQAKGLFKITPEYRVMLNFTSDGWEPLDITDMV